MVHTRLQCYPAISYYVNTLLSGSYREALLAFVCLAVRTVYPQCTYERYPLHLTPEGDRGCRDV